MALPSKTFAGFIAAMTTAWANEIGFTPALQPGDMVLALFEAVSAQLVFLQAQVQLVNAIARAQTSTGSDLDSFYAQFFFTRLPATFNTGQVVFAKYSPSSSATLIPAGTLIQTPGGAAQYAVVANTALPTWSTSQNAYVLPAGQLSLTAEVQATVAGTGPNVFAGALSQIISNLPGIDTVTNPAAINNGKDAESDAAFRARFVLYINSLSKATRAAILSAIMGVQQGLLINLVENVTPTGAPRLGEFVAFIDDGSGSPPASLLTAVFNAVDAVRGFTILPEVVGPTIITPTPTISLNVRVDPTYVSSTVNTNVQAAVVAAVNQTDLGSGDLYVSSIEEAALSVAGVIAVQPGQTLINGANADLPLTQSQVVRVTTANVTVGNY